VTLGAERHSALQSARMSKITNDGLTQSGTTLLRGAGSLHVGYVYIVANGNKITQQVTSLSITNQRSQSITAQMNMIGEVPP